MNSMIAIIGGTGVGNFELESSGKSEVITTKHGDATVTIGRLRGKDIVFLARHGTGHKIPPHRINYRANIAALAALGVTSALATTAVGGLRLNLLPGSLVLLDDFIDFTLTRAGKTFFDGEADSPVTHTDFTRPYSDSLRNVILSAAQSQEIEIRPTGTYVCADGPRYESPAEVRLFASWGGDVVGMTGIPEVTLAREAGIAYAGISLVTNPGAGLSRTPLSHEEVTMAMEANLPRLIRLLTESIARI
jgi:5'-methylthioadenosine phosphorylase